MIASSQDLIDLVRIELESGGEALPGVYGMKEAPRAATSIHVPRDPAELRTVSLFLRGGSKLVITIRHEPHDPTDEFGQPGPCPTREIMVNGEARSLYDTGGVDGCAVYTDQLCTVCGHAPCPCCNGFCDSCVGGEYVCFSAIDDTMCQYEEEPQFFREDGSPWNPPDPVDVETDPGMVWLPTKAEEQS